MRQYILEAPKKNKCIFSHNGPERYYFCDNIYKRYLWSLENENNYYCHNLHCGHDRYYCCCDRFSSINKDVVKEKDIKSKLYEEYYHDLIVDSPFGVALTNKDNIIWCNNQFLTDITKSESCVDLKNYLKQDSFVVLEKAMAEILQNKYNKKQIQIKTNNDRVFTFCLKKMSTPMINERRKLEYVIAIYVFGANNISLEHDRLMNMQRMSNLGQLSLRSNHDLNNHLSVIMMSCNALLSQFEVNEKPYIESLTIKRHVAKSINIIDLLHVLSKPKYDQSATGVVVKIVDIVCVSEVIDNIISLARKLVGETISFRRLYGDEVYCVKTNQTQLEQVLLNMIINAKDAMPDGGIITIKTYAFDIGSNIVLDGHEVMAGKYLSIEIIDNGMGISKEQIMNIFEPFFTTKQRGTGLGLATVREFVKLYNGAITVKSQKNIGTTFVIYLPICEPAATGDEYEQSQDPIFASNINKSKNHFNKNDVGNHNDKLKEKFTILIVEDDEDMRPRLANALTKKGYPVIEAMNGQMAMDIIDIEKTNIKLVISDIAMPDISGIDVATYCASKSKETCYIFISGHAMSILPQSELLAKSTFMQKPFDTKQFTDCVIHVINNILAKKMV